jgi:hypothetical protein
VYVGGGVLDFAPGAGQGGVFVVAINLDLVKEGAQ